MNVAQFLIDLGMKPVPLCRPKLGCPAIGHRNPVMAYDSEMEGYTYVRDENGQTIPDTSKSAFAQRLT